jgi:hypothetical protein
MIRRIVVPLGAGLAAFVLTMPMLCVGSSDRSREWCQTFYGIRIPGSSIEGPVGTAIMYGLPALVAVAVFLAVRALLGRGEGRGDVTSRS